MKHDSSHRLISVLFFILLLMCCKDEKNLKSQEYEEWVRNPDNGINILKKVGDIEYELQYRPYSLIALQALSGQELTRESVDSIRKELRGILYFTLKISDLSLKSGIENVQGDNLNFREKIEYYSFKMQQDIHLVLCEDTLECSLYHLERLFNAAPYNTVLLGFSVNTESMKELRDRPGCDMTVCVDDRMKASGLICIKVKKDDIENVPELTMD